jgi:hypothetical protein
MEIRHTRRYHVIVTERLTFGVEEFDKTGLLRTMTGFLTEEDALRWIETRQEPGLGVYRARLKAELDTIERKDRVQVAVPRRFFP